MTEDVPAVGVEDAACGGRGGHGQMAGKKLRLRWAAACADCGASLAPGDQAWWFHLDNVGRCVTCVERDVPAPQPGVSVAAAPSEVTAQRNGPTPKERAPSAQPERSAGASAQTEYERRRGKDRARIRQNLPRLLLVVVAAPFMGYLFVRIGAELVDTQFRSIASSAVDGGVETQRMFDRGLVHLVGLCVAFSFTLSAARLAFGARHSTEAWRIGAEGERLTARALLKLPSSYRVLHDRPTPRSKANIDHVVIGPTGVFTVETKNYKNGVKIKGGRVYGSGRNLTGVVEQARRQAVTVAAETGATVTPIVCVHGGGVTVEGWFQKPMVNGVRFCSGRRLTKTIAGYPASLSDDVIEQLERRLA